MFGVLIAILSGALMSIQGVFNTGVTKQTGLWVATGFVQITALIVCVIMWFFNRDSEDVSKLFQIDNKYMLLGGVIGAVITVSVVKGMEFMGPAKAVMIIVVSQLVVAYLIEVFGLFGVEKVGFEFRKLLAMLLTIVGIIWFKYK